ncbi:unnamed protein product [Scytosiphon promiscuus]
MEVLPPSPTLPASATSPRTPAAPAPAAATTTGSGDAAGDATGDVGDAVRWATLPDGPVLHDEAAPVGGGGGGGDGGGCVQVALPGTGDSYTCCFAAKGDAEEPAPLGRLRVTWRPEGTEAGERGVGGVLASSVPAEKAAAAAAVGSVGEAVTEFPLPVLSARPPALSARLKAPPHARVGEEFTMRWEISNLTEAYSSMQLTAEDGDEFVWSGRRLSTLQVAPMETISVVYRLVPLVPGHVLLPKVAVVPDREKVNIIPDLTEGRPHIFVRP